MEQIMGGVLTLTMMAVGLFSLLIPVAINTWAERREGSTHVA